MTERKIITPAQAKADLAALGFKVSIRHNSEFGVIKVKNQAGESMPGIFCSMDDVNAWKAVSDYKAGVRVRENGWTYIFA